MRRDDLKLLTLIALAGVGAWLWATKSGRAAAQSAGDVIATGATMVESMIRGERNNNPGNIRVSANNWQGKVPLAQNTDGTFEQFDTVENGIRALARLLLNYSRNYGLNTVSGIITRWAPGTENDTDSYISSVAHSVGVQPSEVLNLNNVNTLLALVTAVIKHENGRVIYDSSIIADGVSRAYT